ncbi:MAG: class I SAM-dependent methyltransferase [Azospirillaceae bacterium]|nr:class I SAM-dependent methyltransferase [Azospirillaceae bacterium]
MVIPIPYQPHRFESAAAYYRRGRPPYAATLINRVVAICGLTAEHHLLDLGCGPGPLAIAFAPVVGSVLALDPEPRMLQAATTAAAEAGVAAKIRFAEGSSYQLGPELGRFRVTTIGRAFHWMDRPDTLRRLDTMIEPDGAVVLFDDHHPAVPDNAWYVDFKTLIERYSDDDPIRQQRKAPSWQYHEAVLLRSPFERLERAAVIERRQTAVADLIDRALSMSSTSPQRLGDRTTALVDALQTLLAGVAVDGLLTEIVETSALIARRPGAE